MLHRLAAKLACRLGFHDWRPELRGHQYEGTVYPVNFRICSYCGTIEQKIFDEPERSARWVKSSLEQ